MCNCKGMVRIPAESNLNGVSMSEHHEACDDYHLLEFKKVTLENLGWVILPPDEVEQFINDEMECEGISREEFTIEKISMTQDQFDNLPEFDGF